MPRHLAIVPDGNRRWARARGLPVGEGHRAGIAGVGPVAAAAWAAGVEVVTVWWGSPANFERRAPDEVRDIGGALGDWLSAAAPALLSAYGARFDLRGRWAEYFPGLAGPAATAGAAVGPGPRRLVVLMAYDGRDELRAAATALGGGGPDAATFARALWTGDLPPVDLVVRTGGEPHLSAGFLLWHIAEAELAFVESPWPDFGPADLAPLLTAYGRRERRFGG